MKRRIISAIAVIVCVVALAVEGSAEKLPEVITSETSKSPPIHLDKVEKEPEGPCGWFNPEACPDFGTPVKKPGCTEKRKELIDTRSAEYPYSRFLGEPTSEYVEIGDGCKKDFEQGTIYVNYNEYAKVLCGPIRDRYLSLEETSSALGWPQSPRARLPESGHAPYSIEWLPTEDLVAADFDFAALEHRYQFENGWIYWHPDYETPLIVMDRFHDVFEAHGGIREIGFPRNDESPDSHEGEIRFQAFDRALIFENIHGELEIFRDEMLDAYLDGASEYRFHPIDDPLDAEWELGLPVSDYMPTPNGSVRLLPRGTIYYRDGEVLQVFPRYITMLDGRVVHYDATDDAPGFYTLWRAIYEDPYLPDYRKDVVIEALGYVGLCGDAARDAIGTIYDNYCSEFVRKVYLGAGVDKHLWGGGVFLYSITCADQLRWIFKHESRFVYASEADTLTAEPGDYISMWDHGHSALVVATSVDGRHIWRVGGNEIPGGCVAVSRGTYFDEETGNINDDLTGFGKLRASFF